MGNRHWPYDPPDPYARSRRHEDDSGWVIAGEEQAPPHGRPAGRSWENGQWAGQPREGGYPPPQTYQTPADPYGGYDGPGGYNGPGGYDGPGSYDRPGGYDRPAPRYSGAPDPARQAGRRPVRLPPPDDEPDNERPPLAPAVSWTIAAYLVPMLLYLVWAFTRSGVAPAGCVDASGAPCPPPRVEAADSLLDVLPAIVGALILAVLIALGLRRMATGWRAASIGLAAAVIGGGIATVVAAALG